MSTLADAIAQLASSDAAERERAAAALYRVGRALADAAVRAWVSADAELAELFVEDKSVVPCAPPVLLPRKSVVGIAVQPESFENIRRANGAPRLADVPPDQDAQEFELHFGPVVSLDILTTRAPGGGGAIARFLEKFGEGIQQVEYYVKNVDRATEILRARCGVRPIYPQTRPGADATRVNFFLASTPEEKRVLIELVETR